MTILINPRQDGDRHAATRWYKSGEGGRHAKENGEQASLSAGNTMAEWDARVAVQRAADDDAQKARHELTSFSSPDETA